MALKHSQSSTRGRGPAWRDRWEGRKEGKGQRQEVKEGGRSSLEEGESDFSWQAPPPLSSRILGALVWDPCREPQGNSWDLGRSKQDSLGVEIGNHVWGGSQVGVGPLLMPFLRGDMTSAPSRGTCRALVSMWKIFPFFSFSPSSSSPPPSSAASSPTVVGKSAWQWGTWAGSQVTPSFLGNRISLWSNFLCRPGWSQT